jgi:16S rRNA A1518/A1519 N6-dimethyltransferase RsmA/KsgA/DIM1 with predicted DNA glycosylase/AP lyase activity
MSLFTLPATFYPTPPALIDKMLACVDFEQVEEILEPSAGDGAIVWAIADRFCSRYNRREKPVDCIELDENLRAILRHRFGKERMEEFTDKHSELDTWENRRDHNPELQEYKRMMDICSYPVRIIHDDFLTYQCAKKYQAIIMNPPFDNGDAHLHKALDIMRDGGQVVCLLNAETIRNRCTNSRKALWSRLNEYEAQVQFLSGEFESSDAQRKTSVEVALINVTVPEPKRPSLIFDRLHKAKEEAPDILPPESLMRMGDKVVQMVEQFQFETACGVSLIREYEALRPYLMSDLESDDYSSCILTLTVGIDSNHLQCCDINKYLHKMRLKYWRSMMKVPWFSNLTGNLQDEFRSTVDKMADYDFTEFNIRQVMEELQSKLSQGVDDTILAIFDKLTEHTLDNSQNIHYYNGWRTNKGSKIGKKAIIPICGAFSTYSWSKGKLNSYEHTNTWLILKKF